MTPRQQPQPYPQEGSASDSHATGEKGNLGRRPGESAQDWWRRARRAYADAQSRRDDERALAITAVMRSATAAAWEEALGNSADGATTVQTG